MRILSITAQKPTATGSGVFLTEMVASFARLGHTQAVVFGMMPDDAPRFSLLPKDEIPAQPDASDKTVEAEEARTAALLADVQAYPVHFQTDALPFPIAGMSDDMPYVATRYRDFTPAMLQAFKAAYAETIGRAIQEFQPDLIVCHHLYVVAAVAAHLDPDCPIMGVCHGTCIRQFEKHNLDNDFVREGMARMDRLFALTAEQAEIISSVYDVPAERISVLGTGYNSHMFLPASVMHDDLAADSKRDEQRLLFVGKVCGKKGVPYLIAAANQVQGFANLSVNLVGGFSNLEEHARIVSQVEASVVPMTLAGKVSQDDLIYNYQHSKVFVLPSLFEGLPLVLIEAMACGCVAVCTDLPGIQPWLAKVAPNAPILFVEPPAMLNVDEPVEDDVPRFESDLACTIEKALRMQGNPDSVTHLSWDALVGRMLAEL